ncbi:uncharacterized protein K460DRAFT_368175 [Cucurbitaria berberidis CBS 394.84]|uniref:Apple domain-containing protein n=1 Tax=Cucurbitaria berberidis CBS 394.84 TaxID=1168544 RepID=A0A9P4GDL5_9PLEO|nr:uncharacterized protein K460DRAFT_368175 [Cucurbitaria berberidis CBS 394.84]KAF1843280.1 hypothetical protein K460DRAFT_368175 [Cucurbitaria berberidis CBS 394.84]
MRTSTTILTAALCSTISALPSPNMLPRAGGPAIVPIPSTCTISFPLPTSPATTTTYQPAPATTADLLYSAYYPAFSTNKTAMAEQCLQQCYGYGYHVECKTAYWAENILVPAGEYGAGELSTACLLFSRALDERDFVVAKEGQATGAFAGSIAC